MLPIPVRQASSLNALVNDAAVISVATVAAAFNDTEFANVAAVAVISFVAFVNDAALEVVNVCCS